MKENKKALGISVSPLEQKNIDLLKMKEAIDMDRGHYGFYFVDKSKRNRIHENAIWSSTTLDINQALDELSIKVDSIDMSEVGDEILIYQLVGIRKINRKITILPVDPPRKDTEDDDE